jgi:hypothetical protein
MKLGLIIQGPIVSGGLTGQTHGFGKTRAGANLLVNFNSNNTIVENIDNATGLFDEIVVSTWKRDLDKLDLSIEKKVKILKLDDPTPNPPKMRKPLKGYSDFGYINTIRQFYSTLEGLKYLQSRGITHAVKLRTDQSIDIPLLHEEIKYFAMDNSRIFFTPFIVPSTPWTISDFYLAGEIKNFIEISEAMINPLFSFHNNVHRDLFFKTAFLFSGSNVSFKLKHFFIFQDQASSDLEEIVDYAMGNIWQAGSKQLYLSLNWRGEKVKNDLIDKKFAGEHVDKSELNRLNGSDNIDWDQLLKVTVGHKSLLNLLKKVILFRQKKMLIKLRSTMSHKIDTLGIRKFFR